MRERQQVNELYEINPLFRSQLEEILIRDEARQGLSEANEPRKTPVPRYVIDGFQSPGYQGSLSAYEQPRRAMYLENKPRDYLAELGDYGKHLYKRTKNWFIEEPHKGVGAIGAVLGGIAGIFAGPLGVLIGMGLGAATSAGVTYAFKRGVWDSGKKLSKNPIAIEF